MWKQCNSVLHAVDEQGLPGQCALELEISIHSKFQQGTDGLALRDWHYRHHELEDVMAMLASDKQTWLQGIQLAHELQIMATPSHQQCQQLMTEVFHTIDN
jgi:hypothetical protein